MKNMYCPSCGKEIPDKSSFCLHCGKSTYTATAHAQVATEWEYRNFGEIVESASTEEMEEIGTVGKFVSYNDLIQHAWSEIRPQLLERIQEWLNDGWESVTPIDSDCMIVETQNAGFLGGTKVFLKGIRIKMRRRREIGSATEKMHESGETLEQDEHLWETCEIVLEKQPNHVIGSWYCFVAKAKGRNGEYVALKSKEFTAEMRSLNAYEKNSKEVVAFQKWLEPLLKDGWELTDNQPSNWWNKRFRRRIQSKKALNQDDAIWLSIKTHYKHAPESWLKIPAIAEVKKHLDKDELPEGVIFGQHPDTGAGGGGLWATNKRLLYVGITFWKKPVVIEYPYNQIGSIAFANNQIFLHHAGKQTTPFKDIDKLAHVSSFIHLVESKLK
jgi:zinc-ribbon domain